MEDIDLALISDLVAHRITESQNMSLQGQLRTPSLGSIMEQVSAEILGPGYVNLG